MGRGIDYMDVIREIGDRSCANMRFRREVQRHVVGAVRLGNAS